MLVGDGVKREIPFAQISIYKIYIKLYVISKGRQYEEIGTIRNSFLQEVAPELSF